MEYKEALEVFYHTENDAQDRIPPYDLNRKYPKELSKELGRAPLNPNYYRASYEDLARLMLRQLSEADNYTISYDDPSLAPDQRRCVNANIDFIRRLYRGLPRFIQECLFANGYVLVEGNRNDPNFNCYVYRKGGRIGGCAEIVTVKKSELIQNLQSRRPNDNSNRGGIIKL